MTDPTARRTKRIRVLEMSVIGAVASLLVLSAQFISGPFRRSHGVRRELTTGPIGSPPRRTRRERPAVDGDHRYQAVVMDDHDATATTSGAGNVMVWIPVLLMAAGVFSVVAGVAGLVSGDCETMLVENRTTVCYQSDEGQISGTAFSIFMIVVGVGFLAFAAALLVAGIRDRRRG